MHRRYDIVDYLGIPVDYLGIAVDYLGIPVDCLGGWLAGWLAGLSYLIVSYRILSVRYRTVPHGPHGTVPQTRNLHRDPSTVTQ